MPKYEYRKSTETEWVDFSAIVNSRSTTITYGGLSSAYKSAIDEATIVIPTASTASNLVMKKTLCDLVIGAKAYDVLVRITQGIFTYYTGKIDSSSVSLTSSRVDAEFSFSCVDSSYLLDNKIQLYIAIPNSADFDTSIPIFDKTKNSVIGALLTYAGYDLSKDLDSECPMIETTLPAFVFDGDNESSTYREVINKILLEHKYVFNFTPNGKFTLVALNDLFLEPQAEGAISYLVASGIKSTAKLRDTDGVKLTWSSLDIKKNVALYVSDIAMNLDDKGNITGQELQPNEYWPTDADLTDTYQEYNAQLLDRTYNTNQSREQNKDLTIICAKHVQAEILKDSVVSTVLNNTYATKAQYAFKNTNNILFAHAVNKATGEVYKDALSTTLPVSCASLPVSNNPLYEYEYCNEWEYPRYYGTLKAGVYSAWGNKDSMPTDIADGLVANLKLFSLRGDVLYRAHNYDYTLPFGSLNPEEFTSEYIFTKEDAISFVNYYNAIQNNTGTSFSWEDNEDRKLYGIYSVTLKGFDATSIIMITKKTLKFMSPSYIRYSYTAVAVLAYDPSDPKKKAQITSAANTDITSKNKVSISYPTTMFTTEASITLTATLYGALTKYRWVKRTEEGYVDLPNNTESSYTVNSTDFTSSYTIACFSDSYFDSVTLTHAPEGILPLYEYHLSDSSLTPQKTITFLLGGKVITVGGQPLIKNMGEWSTVKPNEEVGKYIWCRMSLDKGVSWTYYRITPVDADTLYTWIVYADDAEGTNISTNSTGKAWVGIASNKLVDTPDLTNPSLYEWSHIEGIVGKSPVLVAVTRDTYCFPADANGIIKATEYAKFDVIFAVSQAETNFTYTSSTLQGGEYKVELVLSGITNISMQANGVAIGTADSVMFQDTASVTATITYKELDGVVGTAKKVISLTKLKRTMPKRVATIYQITQNQESPVEGGVWIDYVDNSTLSENDYVWCKTQFVEENAEPIETAWSDPFLLDTSTLNIIQTQIAQTNESISLSAFKIDRTTGKVLTQAGITVGSIDEGGKILLDARQVIATGTITANQIDTENLMAKTLSVNGGGVIKSENYSDDDKVGFRIDSIGNARFYNISILGGEVIKANQIENPTLQTIEKQDTKPVDVPRKVFTTDLWDIADAINATKNALKFESATGSYNGSDITSYGYVTGKGFITDRIVSSEFSDQRSIVEGEYYVSMGINNNNKGTKMNLKNNSDYPMLWYSEAYAQGGWGFSNINAYDKYGYRVSAVNSSELVRCRGSVQTCLVMQPGWSFDVYFSNDTWWNITETCSMRCLFTKQFYAPYTSYLYYGSYGRSEDTGTRYSSYFNFTTYDIYVLLTVNYRGTSDTNYASWYFSGQESYRYLGNNLYLLKMPSARSTLFINYSVCGKESNDDNSVSTSYVVFDALSAMFFDRDPTAYSGAEGLLLSNNTLLTSGYLPSSTRLLINNVFDSNNYLTKVNKETIKYWFLHDSGLSEGLKYERADGTTAILSYGSETINNFNELTIYGSMFVIKDANNNIKYIDINSTSYYPSFVFEFHAKSNTGKAYVSITKLEVTEDMRAKNMVGTFSWFFGKVENVPYGHLICNGSSYSKENYKELYAVIGDTYGTDGNDKFRVPNMMSNGVPTFISAITSINSTVGDINSESLPNVTGNVLGSYYTIPGKTNPFYSEGGSCSDAVVVDSSTSRTFLKMDLSRANSIYSGSHVTPQNIQLVPLIRY